MFGSLQARCVAMGSTVAMNSDADAVAQHGDEVVGCVTGEAEVSVESKDEARCVSGDTEPHAVLEAAGAVASRAKLAAAEANDDASLDGPWGDAGGVAETRNARPVVQRVSDIRPEQQGITLRVRIAKVAESNEEGDMEACCADASGAVTLLLTSEDAEFCATVGTPVLVQAGQVLMRGAGMYKHIGVAGKLSASGEAVLGEINTANNISAVEYEQVGDDVPARERNRICNHLILSPPNIHRRGNGRGNGQRKW
ncbi:unnamed protein product [Prorocentrum cordatum]|uniref:Uncharacterized protein n=1 Tax=Prorocentrum cordatum TaxID=2364126 RepID=A0ABN9UA02_9DINO|nr:unnamed protein product [Polarella glacialis]